MRQSSDPLSREPSPPFVPNPTPDRGCPSPSRTPQFLHPWPRGNKARKHPIRPLLAREAQTSGKSSGEHHTTRTIQSPDRAPDKPHRSQSRQSVLPPPNPHPAPRSSHLLEKQPPAA